MPILWNPTDEILIGECHGITYKLNPDGLLPSKPYEMTPIDPIVANHLIHHLGARGLVSLEYGDDDKVKKLKKERALAKQEAWERKQVFTINRLNEIQEDARKPWMDVGKDVTRFAAKWGMHVKTRNEFKNYTIQKDTAGKSSKEMQELRNKNEKLEKDLTEIKDMLKNLKSKK